MRGDLCRLVSVILIMWASSAVSVAALTVDSSDALRRALAKAEPGSRILLKGGDYESLQLHGGGGTRDEPVMIAPASDEEQVSFSGVEIKRVANLLLEDITFDYAFAEGDEAWVRPFTVTDSENVTLRNVLLDGDLAQGLGPHADGFPTAYGLGVRGAEGFKLVGSEIRGFYKGLIVSESSDVSVLGNDIHSIRMDGMNFSQVEDVVIARNHIHDFDRSPGSDDHADMIQFWTRNTDQPSRNVAIRDNVLESGDGLYTQSIFMRNDLVDQGKAGREMFYRNIDIDNNVIANAHLHGISVGETAGLRITNNTVVENPNSAGDRDNASLYTPQIRVAEAAEEVTIERNVVSKITGENEGWDVAGNVFVQDGSRLKPNHYSKVFDGRPSELATFRYSEDGPLSDVSAGASRLGN